MGRLLTGARIEMEFMWRLWRYERDASSRGRELKFSTLLNFRGDVMGRLLTGARIEIYISKRGGVSLF